MTRSSFEERIIKKYKNRLLTNEEIETICDQAVEEGILQSEDVKKISNCETIELLLTINKWKSAYLCDALKLDGSSESEFETIREDKEDDDGEEKGGLYEEGDYRPILDKMTHSTPSHSPNKSIFYTPHKPTADGSFLSQIYNTPVKSREPENPFTLPFTAPFASPFGRRVPKEEFGSFCEDLKEKTKSIKKIQDEKTAETVKKLIDDFVRYSELNKTSRKDGCGRCYAYLISLVILFYSLYIPKPI